ncbi:hypothetical protein ACFV9E_08635 [Streptomyces sp. NPDC059835]|uniref:hypothetical protein n=1 Tax=Streptomyces sp. NPDC059835 TaxID=3346967 RepID=UPI00366454A9
MLTQILCVDGDTVYLHAKAANGAQWSVVAASVKSGEELWRQPSTAPKPPAPTTNHVKVRRPAVIRLRPVRDGVLLWQGLEGGDDVRLSLHDAATGVERWTTTVTAPGATEQKSNWANRLLRRRDAIARCD